MPTITYKPTLRQHECWLYLVDNTTNEIMFGGSAGGGKTMVISMYLIINSLQYPGTRYALCRSRITNLKRSTVKTLISLLNLYKIDYQYNSQSNIIRIGESEIQLLDLFPFPNDPNFDRFGSHEYTAVCIDEASEVTFQAYEVLKSRIRFKLTEYKIIPKILLATNPCDSWIKNYFYNPAINNTLPENKKFVKSRATDNPYLPETYIETLRNLDITLRKRLLDGDWNFNASDNDLFTYDGLANIFYNEYFLNIDKTTYLTIDVGDLGEDSSVLCVWNGWNCVRIEKLHKQETTQVVIKAKELINSYKISIRNVIVDAVGVGSGVASLLKGCVRYSGAEKALNGEKFFNVKSQLMFKFAEKVNDGMVNLNIPYNDLLIQEAMSYKKEIKNEVFKVTSKDKVRQSLNRSPDTIDALYLRAYFEFKKLTSGVSIVR